MKKIHHKSFTSTCQVVRYFASLFFSYFVTYRLFLHFISAMLWHVAYIDISPQNSCGLLTSTTWWKWLFLVNLSMVRFILRWKWGYRKPTNCQNSRMSNTLSYIAQAQVINYPTHNKKACVPSCFCKASFSKSIHMAGNMLNEIWQCPSAAQCVRMVFNSWEFSAEGCRVIFESPEPPPSKLAWNPPHLAEVVNISFRCTYISDEVLWTRSQRRSDTLNKTNRTTEKLLFVFWI